MGFAHDELTKQTRDLKEVRQQGEPAPSTAAEEAAAVGSSRQEQAVVMPGASALGAGPPLRRLPLRRCLPTPATCTPPLSCRPASRLKQVFDMCRLPHPELPDRHPSNRTLDGFNLWPAGQVRAGGPVVGKLAAASWHAGVPNSRTLPQQCQCCISRWPALCPTAPRPLSCRPCHAARVPGSNAGILYRDGALLVPAAGGVLCGAGHADDDAARLVRGEGRLGSTEEPCWCCAQASTAKAGWPAGFQAEQKRARYALAVLAGGRRPQCAAPAGVGGGVVRGRVWAA